MLPNKLIHLVFKGCFKDYTWHRQILNETISLWPRRQEQDWNPKFVLTTSLVLRHLSHLMTQTSYVSLKLEHRIYKCQSHSCRLQLCTTKVTLKIISGTLGHIAITFSAISVTDKIPLPINSIKAAEESTNLLPWWPLQWASVWDDGAVTATDTKCSLPNDHSHEEWNVASPACMRDV